MVTFKGVMSREQHEEMLIEMLEMYDLMWYMGYACIVTIYIYSNCHIYMEVKKK